jgi:hypothetical protein
VSLIVITPQLIGGVSAAARASCSWWLIGGWPLR